MTDCRCPYPEHHCLSGHHHVVPSLAAECDERASRPKLAVA